MALRRMISTRFFKDPDIMNLSSKDTQLILIGLILAADDEGREVAHAGLLGREMDYPTEQIEAALQELVANELLLLYQVGKHRYYQLTRVWREWQTLGGRITPSRYPGPPASAMSSENALVEDSGNSWGNAGNFPEQENPIKEKKREEEEEKSHQLESANQQNILPFPNPHASNNIDGKQHKEMRAVANQVARILKFTTNDALLRLVAEYATIPGLSLLGEADAAREWINDARRNRQHKRMSLAFFRNWLKRERDAIEQRHLLRQETLASGANNIPIPDISPAGHCPPNLMHLADEDRQIQRTKGKVR